MEGRVVVWGVVVRKFVGEKSIMLILDDFTDTAVVITSPETEVEEGDVVRIIGRIRSGEKGKRIFADVIKKIDTEEELIHRLKNLQTFKRLLEGEEVQVVDLK